MCDRWGFDPSQENLMRRRDFLAFIGGAGAAWPVAGRAQQTTMPMIGLLGSESQEASAWRLNAFRRGLANEGRFEGRNLRIEYRFAGSRSERLRAMASELAKLRVDAIVTIGGTATALAAKGATTVVPILFLVGSDPVKLGLVSSLNRPGGNVTGVTILSVVTTAKRVELLHELLPKSYAIAVLVNPNNALASDVVNSATIAAQKLGRDVFAVRAAYDLEIEMAFAAIVERQPAGVVIQADPLFSNGANRIATLAMSHAVPTLFAIREAAAEGGLLGYGPSIDEALRQLGELTSKVLDGAKPSDLPVMQSTKIDLAINLKTAKALGLAVPATLTARADEVIE